PRNVWHVARNGHRLADPFVLHLRRESVIKARRHHPRGEQVDSRGGREQTNSFQSARSAITWQTIGPTRSLHAQRQRASSRPAAATANRNSGGCDSACAAVHRAVLPMIATGAPPRSSSAAYSAPRNAISSPIETTIAGKARKAGRIGAEPARAAAGSRSTTARAHPPRILKARRDRPMPSLSSGHPAPESTSATPPRTSAAVAA